MKKIMMMTLVLSVMAMGSAMANDNSADRKPKKRALPPMTILMPPPPGHHCGECNMPPHHKCDKRLPHGLKGVHFNHNDKAPNKPPKGGKPGDSCPPHGKDNGPAKGDKGGKPGRK